MTQKERKSKHHRSIPAENISSMDVSGMIQHDTPMQDRDNEFDVIAAAAFMRQSPGCAAFGYQSLDVLQSPRLAPPMDLGVMTAAGKSVAGLIANNPTSDKSPLFVSSSRPRTPADIAEAGCDSEAINTKTQALCTKSQHALDTNTQTLCTKSREAMLDNLAVPVACAAPAVVCTSSKSTASGSTGAGGDNGGGSGTNTVASTDQSAGPEEMRAGLDSDSDSEPSRAQPTQQALPPKNSTYITVHVQEAGRMFLFFVASHTVMDDH